MTRTRILAGLVAFLLVAAVVAVAIVASAGRVRAGEVIRKRHEPPSSFTAIIPIPAGQFCTGSICRTNYIYVPYVFHDDEDWKLTLRDDEGRTGTVYVDAATYATVAIGEWFGDGEAGDSHARERA